MLHSYIIFIKKIITAKKNCGSKKTSRKTAAGVIPLCGHDLIDDIWQMAILSYLILYIHFEAFQFIHQPKNQFITSLFNIEFVIRISLIKCP